MYFFCRTEPGETIWFSRFFGESNYSKKSEVDTKSGENRFFGEPNYSKKPKLDTKPGETRGGIFKPKTNRLQAEPTIFGW